MARIFVYDGTEHKDPDPSKSVDEVRQIFAVYAPELYNAETTQIKRSDDDIISFKKRVGVKG